MNKKYLGKLILCLSFTAILFTIISCNNKQKIKSPPLKNEIRYHDLHLELGAFKQENVPSQIQQLEKKYGTIIPYLFHYIIRVDTSLTYDDSNTYLFFFHPDLATLHDTVSQVFNNTQSLQKEINQLYQNAFYFDSTITLPTDIYFYTSGLNEELFVHEDTLVGIGLDRFFGADFWPYEARGYSRYITRFLTSKNIPIELGKMIYYTQYGIAFEDKNMLELMLHEGKRQYFLSQVLPTFKESDLMGYTEDQWKWCEENELYIYKFFTDQYLFFEKNPTKIMRYLVTAPTSIGMPDQSPGRTGVYIGYQIIKNYAEKTNASLYDILHNSDDAQTILNKAKYKPKK